MSVHQKMDRPVIASHRYGLDQKDCLTYVCIDLRKPAKDINGPFLTKWLLGLALKYTNLIQNSILNNNDEFIFMHIYWGHMFLDHF